MKNIVMCIVASVPLFLSAVTADKDWVKRTFAPTNAAVVANAASVTNVQQEATLTQHGAAIAAQAETNAQQTAAIAAQAETNAQQTAAIAAQAETNAQHTVAIANLQSGTVKGILTNGVSAVGTDGIARISLSGSGGGGLSSESDPVFVAWKGTNTYVKSESDPTVPAWAKSPTPPATGVTNVLVDGTSVVSDGVADVVVSNKQDRLIHTEADRVTVSSFWVDSAMQDWDLIVSAEVLSFNDSAAVVKMGYKWRSHSGISWSSVAVSYREVTANRIVSDPRYYEWYGEIRGYYPPESYDKACHIKLLRESGVSFVEREVDFVPSSASTNRLITSKGVADAIANLPQSGTTTNAVCNLITNHVSSGYLCTVEAARGMTNDMEAVGTNKQTVRGEYDSDSDFWIINVLNANSSVYAENSGSSGELLYMIGSGLSQQYPRVKLDGGVLKYFYRDRMSSQVFSKEYSYKSTTLSGYGITDAYTKTEADGKFLMLNTQEDDSTLNGGVLNIKRATYFGYESGGCYFGLSGMLVLPSWNYIICNDKTLADGGWNTAADPFAKVSQIPSTNGFIKAIAATNAAEAVVGEVMEYGLTNLTANTETFALASGVIGNLALDSAHTNINLTLLYPASNAKSSDILLRVVNAADTTLAINSVDTDVDGTEWTAVKSGTNYVTATRTAYEGGRSKVLVNVKEVK